MKLAVVATHPIQYQVPWFRGLAAAPNTDLTVYYGVLPSAKEQGVGFGVPFEWDIPLLDGYHWQTLPSRASAPGLGGFFANDTPAVREVLSSAAPDAVVITGWNALPLVQTYWAALSLGIPRIVRGDSNALRRRGIATRLLHRVYLAGFDAFLATGRANEDFYLQYGIAPDRIFSAPHFVDNERFHRQWLADREGRAALRTAWNIPSDATCLLYCGKLQPKKRIVDLLEALDVARRATPRLHLLVAGDGELMAEARSIADARRLPVTFAGFLNQTAITRAYAAADCLVLPSDFGETWGLVVNEAMACGLPAIVSDRVGCGPDLVLPGDTGWIFPFGDVRALADLLERVGADGALLRRMGERAHAHIATYSVARAVAGTLAAVDAVTMRRTHRVAAVAG